MNIKYDVAIDGPEDDGFYLARCEQLGLAGSGSSEADARHQLDMAVHAYIHALSKQPLVLERCVRESGIVVG